MAKRQRRPIRSFKFYTTLELIDIVRLVISKMTGNPNFPTPIPTLVTLALKADDLELKYMAARGGGTLTTAIMKTAKADLVLNTVMLGYYIYNVALGDETIMLSSEFPLTKGDIAPILYREFWLKKGPFPGEVLAFCKAIPRALSYIWMIYIGETEPDNDDAWKFVRATSKARTNFKNLEQQTKIWVRVCAVTTKGMTPWLTAEHIMVR